MTKRIALAAALVSLALPAIASAEWAGKHCGLTSPHCYSVTELSPAGTVNVATAQITTYQGHITPQATYGFVTNEMWASDAQGSEWIETGTMIVPYASEGWSAAFPFSAAKIGNVFTERAPKGVQLTYGETYTYRLYDRSAARMPYVAPAKYTRGEWCAWMPNLPTACWGGLPEPAVRLSAGAEAYTTSPPTAEGHIRTSLAACLNPQEGCHAPPVDCTFSCWPQPWRNWGNGTDVAWNTAGGCGEATDTSEETGINFRLGTVCGWSTTEGAGALWEPPPPAPLTLKEAKAKARKQARADGGRELKVLSAVEHEGSWEVTVSSTATMTAKSAPVPTGAELPTGKTLEVGYIKQTGQPSSEGMRP